MVDITAAEVFRDFVTDGVPSSGAHNPRKPDIRKLLTQFETIIAAFTSNGGVIYASKAAMDADLARPANTMAWVLGDAVAANNGIYRKVGASGAGSWARAGDLPYSFILAEDSGAGTANAIQATSSLPISGSALVLLNIFEANTDSSVTVSFNGSSPLPIKTNTGNDPAPGGLQAGMLVMGRVSGAVFRLVSDQDAAAIIAQAEAILNEVEEARDEVLGMLGGVTPVFATKAIAEAYSPAVAPSFLQLVGSGAPGDGGGALYKKVDAEPSHVGKLSITLDDGVTVAWYEKAPSSLNFQGKDVLPTVGAAYIVDETYQVDAADENYILNGDFSVWHEGYMQTSLSENTNAMILAQWRAETVGVGTSINSIRKISGASGGLRFNAVFGAENGFAYVRQNLLGVRQFSGKQFTSVIDIEVDVACVLDFYVRMRINASDASVDRPLVVDTNELAISPGRKLVAVTFDCPDISSFIGVENYQNSLEYAFRVQGSGKTVDVKVYGATVTSGRKLRAPARATYIENLTVENACFEVGVAQINGFTATSGQKRLFTQYRSKKIRTPVVKIYDMAGTADRVSTYDSAGTRTDGVIPGSVINDDLGVGVVLISSTACGIAFRYAANAYP